MKKVLLFSFLLLSMQLVMAQAQPATKANYQLASRFSPKKLAKMAFSTSVSPHWFKKSDRFWYVYETTSGRKWYIVDPAKREKKDMFDNDKLAAELTMIVKDPFDAQHLTIDSLRLTESENGMRFEVKSTMDEDRKDTTVRRGQPTPRGKKTFYFEYTFASGKLIELKDFKKPARRPNWASISPDSSTVVFARNYNLYKMDKDNYVKALKNESDTTIVETQITKDGIEFFAYGGGEKDDDTGHGVSDSARAKPKRRAAYVLWSPDSKQFAMVRSDTRKLKEMWVINSIADPRPTLKTYKYQLPGEKEAPEEYVLLFDAATGNHKTLGVSAFKNQDVSISAASFKQSERDDDWRPLTWLGTKDKFYLTRTSRDLKRIDIMSVDVTTGAAKVLIEERMNTYVETRKVGLVADGKELIQWSERDGWGHFYLYNGDGTLKNQITSGPFHCEDIVGIDEKKRVLYFSANGREAKEDPYYLHLYKVNFDGSGLTLLNSGDFDHTMSLNDNSTFFVDNYSRVNTIPKSTLYSADGRKVMDLETADLKQLFAAGYKFPETFVVKADDGITDIYGVMYKPYDFDSTKKYPVVAYVYPGPQTEAVLKAFSKGADRTDRLAQIGVIVVTMGNRGGNPSRSKWYHNYGYGNLRDYGLADKKAAIEQLADRFSYIDINRVGIHGHSGGGFMSTAAMLVYPDFFKAAVSSSGNHDNSIYNRWWSEKHHGVKEIVGDKGDTSFVYNIDKNPDLAKNLKGHLMLTTGDVDDNVNPANTIRVINALIRANKRFDIMLLPGQAHAYGDMQEWFFWGLADYYSKWLLGDFSQPVDIMEMNREVEQKGSAAPRATMGGRR